MPQQLAAIALLVPDYDEARQYYTEILGFDLVEDTPQGPGKRWLMVRPPGSAGALLLAKAANPAQAARVGDQTGGRVFLFLHTDDFWRDYHAYTARGVAFREDFLGKGAVVVAEPLIPPPDCRSPPRPLRRTKWTLVRSLLN